MGLTFSPVLPTPLDEATNGVWGDDIVQALNDLNSDQFKVKTADDTRTTTTLTDDTHLAAMTLGVGTWLIEVGLLVSGPAAGDVKVAYAFSGTTTLAVRGGAGPSSAVGAGGDLLASVPRFAGASDTGGVITTSTPYGLDGTNWSWIIEKAVLTVSVSGTFKIQTAQLAASGTTTIRTGSYVHARKVSS
jgi:hypothetical protein